MTARKLISVALEPQQLGIDVSDVHDVIRLAALNVVPLAPGWVAGVMNLRGRIVTAIDLRRRLGLPESAAGAERMCVVIEHRGEPYGLIVDSVGDVIDIDVDDIEPNPLTLDVRWQGVSEGVVKLETLVVVANVAAIIDAELAADAA